MAACTRGTPVTRTALRQMPTMPRCEHDVTTTRPRSLTLATRVCSPMKVSWTISPSSSTRRLAGGGRESVRGADSRLLPGPPVVHEGLLSEEGVLDELPVLLDPQTGGDRLEVHRITHLSAPPGALG